MHRAITTFALAATLSATTALAGGGRGHDDRDAALVGTWEVRMTPYVCATGVPVPNSTFDYLVSFHDGGTLTEVSANASFQAGQRAMGLGTWERSGRSEYVSSAKAFILFTSVVTPPALPRYVRGAQYVDWTIALKGADRFEAIGPVSFADENGNPVTPSGCVRGVGARLV